MTIQITRSVIVMLKKWSVYEKKNRKMNNKSEDF